MKRKIIGYFHEDEELCLAYGYEPDAEIKWINNKQALIIDGEKIFIDHRKTIEIPTCPRCNSENVHIWKRSAKKCGNDESGYFMFFNFKCRDCGLKREVRTDSNYFKMLIDTSKEDQANYIVGLLQKQGNAFISKWMIDLFSDAETLEKWLTEMVGMKVVLRHPNDPEMDSDGCYIAEVK